jgi:surfeit locus 1 family protein
MSRRLPIGPTLFVLLAVPVMLALGYWQMFVRAPWKDAVLTQLAANSSAPVIALPQRLSGALAFRRVEVRCASLISQGIGGAAASATGAPGFRHLALCEPVGGEPVLVSLGVARDPKLMVQVPRQGRHIGRLVPRSGMPAYLLVSETPLPPLLAETPPGIATIPNSHRSYGLQWWLFALSLSVIYLLYVRRWRQGQTVAAAPPRR